MAGLPYQKVERALLKKGFSRKNKSHRFFQYYTQDGKTAPAHTMTSHNRQEINDSLARQMSKQMHLTVRQFYDFVDCYITQEKYEEILKDQDVI